LAIKYYTTRCKQAVYKVKSRPYSDEKPTAFLANILPKNFLLFRLFYGLVFLGFKFKVGILWHPAFKRDLFPIFGLR